MFSTTRTQRIEPHGRNGNGNQIVLFTSRDSTSFVSALQVNINLRNAGYTQPLVTADRDFAATSTQYRANCVVVVGASAVSDIEAACSSMGLSCESFSDFADWESSGSPWFINADGATTSDTYTLANTAATQATNAGWLTPLIKRGTPGCMPRRFRCYV